MASRFQGQALHGVGRLLLGMVAVVALAISVGCGDDGDVADPGGDAETLRIASFDFAESELLAEVYAQIAESEGVPVTRLGPVGPREIVSPALEAGSIDLIPEYLGTALRFAGNEDPPSDPTAAAEVLGDLLRDRGLVVLAPAPAQDVNVFAVSAESARTHDLVNVSDLAGAGLERFGGPVECPDRPFCLVGLAETYGVEFDEFVPQPSLMFTAESLRRGEIDVGLLFSTAPEVDEDGLAVLDDDRGLQPPENLIPVIRADALDRWGPGLVTAIDQTLAALTTDGLRELNRAVVSGRPVADVVAEWLEAQGIDRGAS